MFMQSRAAAPGPQAATDAPVVRALLVSDSRTRCGAILQWIATENGGTVERVNAEGGNLPQDIELRRASAIVDGRLLQVYGISPSDLMAPALAPLLNDVVRIVVIAASGSRGPGPDAAAALDAVRGSFTRGPVVSWALTRSEMPRAAAVLRSLKGDPFRVRGAIADAGDFAALWRDLRVFDSGRTNSVKSASTPSNLQPLKGNDMANAVESLNALMQIDGALGGLIADYQSGMLLAKTGAGVNLDIAAAGNSEVIKSKMKTINALGLKEGIEDMLITLGTQYHVLRPLAAKPGLFLYLVLDKARANLAMARFKVQDVEKAMAL
jgi:hypothetical protein